MIDPPPATIHADHHANTRRLNTSKIAALYAKPASIGMKVMSDTHT